MKIYLGADHRGFEEKEKIKQWLAAKDYKVEDLGNYKLDPDDDYPIFSEKVGKAVAKNPGSLGILLCGSGVGATAAVNKIDGVVASVGISVNQVRAGRHDDDMNVLVLAADETPLDKSKALVKIFIKEKFGKAKRYERRLKQVEKLEDEN